MQSHSKGQRAAASGDPERFLQSLKSRVRFPVTPDTASRVPDLLREVRQPSRRSFSRTPAVLARLVAAVLAGGVVSGVLWLTFWSGNQPGREQTPVHPNKGSSVPAGSVQTAGTLLFRRGEVVPTATLHVGEETYSGVPGPFCWKQTDGELCAEPFAEVTTFLPVSARAAVEVSSDSANLSVTITPSEVGASSQVLDEVDGMIYLPSEPGRYIMKVEGEWTEGSVIAYFGLELRAAEGPG